MASAVGDVIGGAIGIIVALLMAVLLVVFAAYALVELDEVIPDLAEVDLPGIGLFESLGPLSIVFGVVLGIVVLVVVAPISPIMGLVDKLE